jgi:hypothetical protein
MKIKLNPKYNIIEPEFRLGVIIRKKHIKKGVRGDPYWCPVAVALRDHYGIRDPLGVYVGYAFTYLLMPNGFGGEIYGRFQTGEEIQRHYDHCNYMVDTYIWVLPVTPSQTLLVKRDCQAKSRENAKLKDNALVRARMYETADALGYRSIAPIVARKHARSRERLTMEGVI